MHLKAQHAKESHLKAIKKFQIMYALKIIQRYWKGKYQDIRVRSAKVIQASVRRFVSKMNNYRAQLRKIKQRLLHISLKRALVLYIKKRRMGSSATNVVAPASVVKKI